MKIQTALRHGILGITLLFSAICAGALEPGDVIINEVFFSPKGGAKGREAVELLVVKDGVNLNGLTISDRDVWNKQTEDQCTLQDLGQGFLNSVRSGTLIVIYNSTGEDETKTNNFVLKFYAKSSLYCNTAPTGNAFRFANKADNLHLFHLNRQIDFLTYRSSDLKTPGPGSSGSLNWHGGTATPIDVGPLGESTGFRFMGNKADLNDYPATWQAYSESLKENNNLGKPNGGVNTDWIRLLREKSVLGRNIIVRAED